MGRTPALLLLLAAIGLVVMPSLPADAPAAEAAADAVARVEVRVPERLLSELREERRRLARRKLELDAREQAVTVLEEEALRMLAEVTGIRIALEKRIAAREQQEGDRVKRLAKVYAAMPADRAAPLLEGLDLDLATEILTKMKHKSSAQVLALMPSAVALRLSRRVARPLSGNEPEAPRVRPGGTQ